MSDDEYTDDDSASDAPNDDGLDGKSLYESIGVAKDATPTEIKKAYHRMALKLHPDKNPDNPDAAKQFQTLQKVYGVLGDVDKRKVYDETGRIDDAELSGDKFDSLYEYYRGVYRKVTEEDVDAFHDSYRGGDEERRDEEAVDAHRFADIVDEALKNKKVTAYSAYSSWAKAVRNKRAPKDPLRKRAGRKLSGKKKGDGGTGNDDGDLMAMILSRQNSRAAAADDLFARLEAKYGHDDGGKKKGGKGKDGATKVKGGGVAKKKAK
jgi:DnaJ family protein C protein 9